MEKSDTSISLPSFNNPSASGVEPKRSHMKEFIVAFIACIGPIAVGSVGGYSSTSIPEIKERFPFHGSEESLIGSLMTLGATFGGLVAGALADYFGRKALIMYICAPFTIGWALISGAQNLYMIYVGRLFTGFCTGVVSMCANVYVTEISSPEVRGVLGCCFQLFVNIGILFAYSVGTGVRWNYLAVLSALMPAMLVVFMIPLPESPSWLVRQGHRLDAVRSIRWLRGPSSDADGECREIEAQKSQETKMALSEFSKPVLLRPLLLMVGEMAIQQFCGINAIIFNTVTIFQSATEKVDSHLATIIIGLCAVAASCVTFFVIERAGRRILLLISAAFMGFAMILLDTYYCLKDKHPEFVADMWAIPIVCLVIYIMFFNIGFGPVPWLMMGEVFPMQARGIASSLITAINWFMAFVVTYNFVSVKDAMGPFGIYYFFGSVSLVGIFFVYFFVPETKGKSLEEVQQHFAPKAEKPL